MSIGDNIRQQRHAMHLTLEEVADQVGVSRQTMSRYETGIIANIPSDKIELLARVLKTTPSALMGWDQKFTNVQAEALILSLLCQALNLPQEALFFENGIIRVKNEFEPLLPPGWEQLFTSVCRLIIFNSPIPTMALNSNQEFNFYTKFTALNNDGKEKLLERADELLELPKYRMDGTAPNTPTEGK